MFGVMDRQQLRHVLRGYLSAFSLFPPPARRIDLDQIRRRPTEHDGPFVKVGEYLRFALGQVRNEARNAGPPGEQQPPC
jgi:hypothetical protein